MNIWIIERESGLPLFFKSYTGSVSNEYLISGLIAALNKFTSIELKQLIESIEMVGLRWIYIHDIENNLLFVASDTKDISTNFLKSRLNIIRDSFIKHCKTDKSFVENRWIVDNKYFKPYNEVIDKYYSQWTKVEHMITYADFYDLLGIFQQLLNLIKKIIDKHIFDIVQEYLYESIEEKFQNFRDQQYVKKNQELSKISFSRDSGFNVININPINCDPLVVKKQLIYLLRKVIEMIKEEIGYDICLVFFAKENIFNYVLNNLVLLKKLNLDGFLLQLFLLN